MCWGIDTRFFLKTRVPHPTSFDTWKETIANGKPGTLMPGFATAKNGPLTDAQVESVARYLAQTIPSKDFPKTNSPVVIPVVQPKAAGVN